MMAALERLWLRTPPGRREVLRHVAALLVVLAGFLGRDVLEPVFGATHTYTVFYPGVILAAYFLGGRPATLTAALSGFLGYWRFTAPEFGLKDDPSTITTLCFFALTSAVSIYFITGMRRALAALAAARAEAEHLAGQQAGLFRNLNERVTNHLQLVAALLQLQARDAEDRAFGRALSEASARTLLISRVHREIAGETDQLVDFDSFSKQLLEAALSAHDRPAVRVEIAPLGAKIPLDEATSVAVVLLECLHARIQAGEAGVLHVGFVRDARRARLTVTGRLGARSPAGDLRPHLIEAMVEQLGGWFSSEVRSGEQVSSLEFPVRPDAAAARPAATLH